MKIDWQTGITVLLALLAFEIVKKLFLDEALDKMVDKVKGDS